MRTSGAVLGSGLLLAGCGTPLSTLDPAGPAARSISTLWWAMLGGSVAILLLVMILLALGFRRGGEGAVSERRWIVGGGLVFPVVTLAALLGVALWTGERLLPRAAPDVVSVDALSYQYGWTFVSRGDDGAERAGEGVLRIPAGRPVDVRVTSRDVIHAFWVPRLAGKIDAIPGHINTLRIRADVAGRYAGACAEYCGIGHADHGFAVEAMDPAAYDAWVSGR